MASIKQIEKEVKKHSKQIAGFNRFLKNEWPELKDQVGKMYDMATNGSFRKMTPFQFWTLILGILTILGTLLLRT
jgi:hypothetical protein